MCETITDMHKKAFFAAALALFCSLAALAQTPRYCNPLPMPVGAGGNASGDVTVLEEGGKYYMYCTGGGRAAASAASMG